MTQTTAYTTLEASVFASKGLAECKVLVVDDEQSSCLLITTILSDIVQCAFLHDPAQVIDYCEKQPPDLIVLDINMPGINGIELCQQLKQNRSELSAALERLKLSNNNTLALKGLKHLKGKLKWPVNGRLKNRFGRQSFHRRYRHQLVPRLR